MALQWKRVFFWKRAVLYCCHEVGVGALSAVQVMNAVLCFGLVSIQPEYVLAVVVVTEYSQLGLPAPQIGSVARSGPAQRFQMGTPIHPIDASR